MRPHLRGRGTSPSPPPKVAAPGMRDHGVSASSVRGKGTLNDFERFWMAVVVFKFLAMNSCMWIVITGYWRYQGLWMAINAQRTLRLAILVSTGCERSKIPKQSWPWWERITGGLWDVQRWRIGGWDLSDGLMRKSASPGFIISGNRQTYSRPWWCSLAVEQSLYVCSQFSCCMHGANEVSTQLVRQPIQMCSLKWNQPSDAYTHIIHVCVRWQFHVNNH